MCHQRQPVKALGINDALSSNEFRKCVQIFLASAAKFSAENVGDVSVLVKCSLLFSIMIVMVNFSQSNTVVSSWRRSARQ
jgi:hypothetical protein